MARQGGDEDHRRSAFGRYVAESVFWTPAALLPSANVSWKEVGPNSTRVLVKHSGLEQEVEIHVGANGEPEQIQFLRWSNANAEQIHRLQPFGGSLSDFREVDGFKVPFYVEAGNMFGTEDYFPFFKAKIQSLRYPR